MAWTKILMTGDAATELTGTAYKMLLVDSAGDVIELTHGTSGKFLKSAGASADPIWDDPSVATLDTIGDVAAITEAQGQVIFRGAAAWDALDPGTSGYFLKTQGASTDPVWAAASVAAINDITDVVITTVADNELLTYDNATSKWINQTADEVGLLSDTVPNTVEPDDAASAGTATDASRQDHEHAIVAATPSSVGTTLAEGTGTSFVREDHVHDLGADSIDSGDLIADDVVDTEHLAADSVDAAAIDDTATDIALAQVILTPAVTGTGTTEGTLFYDSDDDHLYVYVV